ncbi:hypothetical protein GLYMA_07G271500v4 [Glycine max]|uniref:Uncharacterized protein n=1 Tax=Glycine max TaxID=3847 RepID=K7L426_SOYBN|nr:hypothetical protein GYH30_019740 [Glycine max]KRH51270.1 hypothetical protein GLYMA_07G271500v4 [Glycine max]
MPKCIPTFPSCLHLSVCDILVTYFTVNIINYLICNVCLNSEGTSFSVSWHGFSFFTILFHFRFSFICTIGLHAI